MPDRNRPKSAFLTDELTGFRGYPVSSIDHVYGAGRRERIAELTDAYPHLISGDTVDQHAEVLAEVDVLFSTWGMPVLSDAQISRMKNLKAVFYAAGATGHFRKPYLDRGIIVCGTAPGNAIPVAEFCLGQILLAAKGYFRNAPACTSPDAMQARPSVGRGSYGARVSLIGTGTISRTLKALLEPFSLEVETVPAATPGELDQLREAFASSYIVSNHLPDLPGNAGVFREEHFAAMPAGATFINTGRGRQVNEEDLARVLRNRPDLTALLDVQHPEPPAADSPLYTLPNAHLSSHIAGAFGDEVLRLADFMIEDYIRWRDGEPLQYQVTEDML